MFCEALLSLKVSPSSPPVSSSLSKYSISIPICDFNFVKILFLRIMNSFNDIQFPTQTTTTSLKTTLDLLDKFITDVILYFAYGIAILSAFKFIIYLINGFTTKSYMGSSTMDNSAFSSRKDWIA